MSEEQEEMGQLIDRLDNLANALSLPIPDSIHVDAMRKSLPDLAEELKQAFVKLTGQNPWE